MISPSGESILNTLILFDFDGVLADNLDEMLSFAAQACAQLGYACQPAPADLEALEVMDMVSYGRQLGILEPDLHTFADALRHKFITNPQPMKIFPGMRALLASPINGCTQAIVTGNARQLVVDFLRHHGLQERIDLIYSGDMPGTRQHKILKAMRDAGANAGHTCLVSDAVSDIHEARQTGIRSIAVTWGYQSRSKLASYHPHAIAGSPGELALILAELCAPIVEENT